MGTFTDVHLEWKDVRKEVCPYRDNTGSSAVAAAAAHVHSSHIHVHVHFAVIGCEVEVKLRFSWWGDAFQQTMFRIRGLGRCTGKREEGEGRKEEKRREGRTTEPKFNGRSWLHIANDSPTQLHGTTINNLIDT